MAATSHHRAAASERHVYARRLALAAIASGLLHLLLWGGLTATRLTLLGSTPQDATAPKPALKPKLAADFPLQVPKSPTTKPAHEQPLDMQVMPRQPQDMTRPEPDRRQPPAAAATLPPEQPLPIVVAPPALERPSTPREALPNREVENAAAPDRQRLATTAEPAVTTADQLAAAPGRETAALAPKPAASTPRAAGQESAAVSRRRPREIAMSASPLPLAQPLSPRVSPADRDVSEPPPLPTPAPAVRRGIVNPSDAPTAAAEPIASPITRPAAAAVTAAATAPTPRPQSSTAGLTAALPRADRGTWAPARSSITARDAATDAAADSAADGSRAAPAVAVTRPGAGRTAAGAGEASSAAARDAVPDGLMSPAPLARSAIAGGTGTASAASSGSDAPVPALAVTDAAGRMAPGNAGSATIAPSPRAVSRLGDRLAASSRGPAMASASDAGDGGDAGDAEQLSSLAEAGSFAGGLPARDRGDAPVAMIVPQPLDRVAAVTLPVEGRVREIAIPFARRSRASREARGGEQPTGELAVREKTRVKADAMVDRGLDFLARAQQPDGRWRLGTFPGSTATDTPKLSCDTAATGLAVLSFLGAGHDHFGGRHRDTVRRGLEFLLSVQKADGDLYLPADKLSDSCAWLYSHGIATMALCEAVGMTGDPLIKPAAAKACDFIASSQHPSRGGWRYTPRSDADLSVSGWMLVALRSGRLAGVEVDSRSFDGVKTLLDASAITGDPARYHYNPRNPQQRPSQLSAGCMTAVGTLMRLHTGWKSSDPRVRQSAQALAALRPTYGTLTEKTRDCYLWYYASQVLVHTGGDEWADWYDQLAATLEQTQERSGPAAGSWNPLGTVPDRWGQYGGRIYVTALHLLALEVPDRRLPTYGSPEDAVER